MTKTILELIKKQWPDQKMTDFVIKQTVFVDMGEYWLDLLSKPRIDKTIYYADQKPGTYEMAEDPGTSWEVFKNYNMRLNSPREIIKRIEEKTRQAVIFTRSTNDKTGGLVKGWGIVEFWEKLRDGYRYATEQEIEKILASLKIEISKYETRLEKYYKRYQKNIRTRSYWADR